MARSHDLGRTVASRGWAGAAEADVERPPPFQRFWFFAAGLTNVRVDIEVTDTETGESKTYVNPQNQPFAPIQDTEGFDTCSE